MKNLVESRALERFIIGIILLNAIILGLETDTSLSPEFLNFLSLLDKIFLSIFVVELLLKMAVYRLDFFKDPWRVFDFIIVGISLLPASGPFSVLRALRVMRTLRMVSVIPSLRKVINGLLVAIPGLGAVGAIIGLVFYVAAVIATKLYGPDFPDWFGDIWLSSYSLFQIMTLESWSMGIVRPVMEKHPFSWMFFLPFILVTTFTTLNLFIAVMVNAMQAETDAAAAERAEQSHEERTEMLEELKRIRKFLEKMDSAKGPNTR